jgi:hypothetical protein
VSRLTESLKVRVTGDERDWLRRRAEQTDRSEGAIVRAALRLYREQVERDAEPVTR